MSKIIISSIKRPDKKTWLCLNVFYILYVVIKTTYCKVVDKSEQLYKRTNQWFNTSRWSNPFIRWTPCNGNKSGAKRRRISRNNCCHSFWNKYDSTIFCFGYISYGEGEGQRNRLSTSNWPFNDLCFNCRYLYSFYLNYLEWSNRLDTILNCICNCTLWNLI